MSFSLAITSGAAGVANQRPVARCGHSTSVNFTEIVPAGGSTGSERADHHDFLFVVIAEREVCVVSAGWLHAESLVHAPILLCGYAGAVERPSRRHGRRELRSAVTGPQLPLSQTRESQFVDWAAEAASHAKSLWQEELAQVRFRVSDLPALLADDADRVPLWQINRDRDEITLFRLVYERLLRPQLDDEWQERFAVEGAVYRAVAEYLGKDPWEVAPDRYRHG